jgi:hypothetical protein
MMRASMLLPVALAGLFACGSGSTLPLNTSPRVPASEGELTVTSGENDNTKLKIDVEHLAPPSKVAADATTYVVWARGNGTDQTPRNLGALQVDKGLTGQLTTVTPLRSFALTITPEPSAVVAAPSHDPVMSAQVTR